MYRIIYESISVLDSSQMQFQSENGEWIHSFLSKICILFQILSEGWGQQVQVGRILLVTVT